MARQSLVKILEFTGPVKKARQHKDAMRLVQGKPRNCVGVHGDIHRLDMSMEVAN
jgi:hypothetical protein